jgi:beta-fructofuranosidase
MLKLDATCLWDCWLTRAGDDFHLFYLQADCQLTACERDREAHIGHAVSTDLRNWTLLPPALNPSRDDPNAPDSLALGPGCVIREHNLWYLFYTGTSQVERGLVERVCLATSSDLVHWTKSGANPVVELDETWYEGLHPDHWPHSCWRSPWVIKDVRSNRFHMLLSCRSNRGAPDGRGAIGQAWSDNLIDWNPLPAFLEPGRYGELTAPQMVAIGDRYYLFCCALARPSLPLPRSQPVEGIEYFASSHLAGPYQELDKGLLKYPGMIGGRVVQGGDDEWYLLPVVADNHEPGHVSYIANPVRLRLLEEGRLALAEVPKFE